MIKITFSYVDQKPNFDRVTVKKIVLFEIITDFYPHDLIWFAREKRDSLVQCRLCLKKKLKMKILKGANKTANNLKYFFFV